MKYLNLLMCSLSLLASAAAARAEELSVDQMVCALDPQCSSPLGERRMRGISATSPVTAAVRPGSFDVTLNFPYNSAELTAESRRQLDQVAKALTEPSTNTMDIVISGHTDARGSPDYNLKLSERRAQAVQRFLITERGISPSRLVAKGYGKTQLLLPSDPYSELNRRVQFQNAKYATASAPMSSSSSADTSSAPQAGKPAAQKSKASAPAARSSGSGGDGL